MRAGVEQNAMLLLDPRQHPIHSCLPIKVLQTPCSAPHVFGRQIARNLQHNNRYRQTLLIVGPEAACQNRRAISSMNCAAEPFRARVRSPPSGRFCPMICEAYLVGESLLSRTIHGASSRQFLHRLRVSCRSIFLV